MSTFVFLAAAALNELICSRHSENKFGAIPVGSWHYIYGDRVFSAMHMYKFEKVRERCRI